MTVAPVFETVLPVDLSDGAVRYAQGIRAGPWVFATGHMATDFRDGLAPTVENPRLPAYGKPRHEREAAIIFDHLQAVLDAAGTDFTNVVRLDQYYPHWRAVDPYHVVRRAVFGGYVPPSTSVLQNALLLPGAEMEVQLMAIVPDSGLQILSQRPAGVWVPPTSGFTPVVRAGDFVFVAGQMATDEHGIAAEARLGSGQLWGGTRIKKETEFIITRRLEPALESCGASLDDIVKAQVYMNDVEDFPAFNSVWTEHFPENPPVTTLVPTLGFGHQEGKIEINVIAIAGNAPRSTVHCDIFTGYHNQSVAIRGRDLLFISGLMAVDHDGLVSTAEVNPRQPFFKSSIDAQMECILDNAGRIASAAGTSLDKVVRIQQFHTDLRDFYPAYQVWQRWLPGQYLPFSAVQVPDAMPVPGCSVILDLWLYAP